MPFFRRATLVFRFPAACLFGIVAVASHCGAPDRSASPATDGESYREPFRPQYHFSPPQNWMNDPNGLVFYDGEYHLFYQYNPFGIRWGHMSWGHAVSPDLVHWTHLPLALAEEDGVMIFSGGAVVDWNNTSGFGAGDGPPLVAIYTGHNEEKRLQHQNLAYSNDRGRTWTKYSGNPVLNFDLKDFRDPKVFWHQPGDQWIMVVSLPEERKIQFYGSPDLKGWTRLGEFGPEGVVDGIWECPDLFELPVEGEAGVGKWILQVDLGDNPDRSGSGGQYFIGEFDGRTFRSDPAAASPWQAVGTAHQVDYGADFYASVSWSDIPASDGRRLWIGWMNNWRYGQEIPTTPWRSAQSIPRELRLVRVGEGLRLAQAPVRELAALRGPVTELADLTIEGRDTRLADAGIRGRTLEIEAEFEPGTASEFGIKVLMGAGQETRIGYDAASGEVFVDRRRSGQTDFHPEFAAVHRGPLALRDGRIKLRIFVDWSSVEVFGNDGLTVITDQVFPAPEADGVELYAEGGSAVARSVKAWTLSGTWDNSGR